jgi:crotonobetaine/carnitine-CoA ligase
MDHAGIPIDLGSLVREKAARHGERPFIRFERRVLTYRQLDTLSSEIAQRLAGQAVSAGTHVAMIMDNSPTMVLVYVALAKLGAVAVPLNTAAKGEMLSYFLVQADASFVIVDECHVSRLADALHERSKLRGVFVNADQVDPEWPLSIPIARLSALPLPECDPDLTDADVTSPYMIMFTSGTTGRSKGVVVSQASMLIQAEGIAQAGGFGPDDVLYTCLPLFHANAWWCCVVPGLLAESEILLSRRFSTSRFWDEVREGGVTQFNLLGAMATFLWQLPESIDDRNHKIRSATVVPIPQDFYHGFERRYGIELRSLYGLTDGGISAIKRKGDPVDKWRAAGRPCDYVEIRIADDEDFPLPPGEVGEILLRNRRPWALAQGYHAMPEASVEAWRNLWLHTGDRGFLDADGYLYFVDRKKDSIRRRGENISAMEVEHIVSTLAGIGGVAAFGVAASEGEEEVMIAVVLAPGARLGPEEIIAHCAANMPYFMVPRFIEFLDELPRNTSEKVEKYKLRAAAENRLEMIWDRERAGIDLAR